MSDMKPILAASAVSFAYADVPVLHGVSLQLIPGRVAALIGPNGSGKSTLIKVLSGHLHGTGEIILVQQPLASWRRRLLARTIAYLPQSPTYDPADRVADVLRLGRACYWSAFGIEDEHDLNAVSRVASLLDLQALMHRRMDAISGGQRQRVFIGRCLVQEPSILFLDEPNTYLDLKHQVDLLKLLRTLAHEHGLSVLMASHDLNLAGAFADELFLLSGGALVVSGTAQEVLRPEIISKVYGLEMAQLSDPTHHLLFPRL